MSVSLLRSVLLEQGIACDLFYANLLFSRLLGGDPLYEEQIALGALSELAFTPYYFEGFTSPQDAARVLHDHFAEFNIGHPGAGIEPYTRLLSAAGRFVDQAFAAVEWSRYDIVGFSLMFQQTLASLALAKRIKARYPGVTIVCGGPSCAEPMGGELVRSFPEIDYVVSGEGDAVIGPLVRHIRSAETECEIPGVIWRHGGEVRRSRFPARQFMDLESLPLPDYRPYFHQVEALGLDHFHPILYIEGSRGCWWGQKHHCTFCGIEEMLMPYRSKSADKMIAEIVELSRRHHITSFLAADNILDYRAYKTLLPRLHELRQQQELDFSFFFEMKANVTRDQVRLLRDAGVARLQPGIESFNDHILKLMDKGCTGIGQLYTLRMFAEFDIQPVWNLIYMNPGERPEDYREMAKMVPYMHHIPPPSRQNQVQMLLQRFNLYFEQPERYGIEAVRPQALYQQVFPDPSVDLNELAYFFEGRHDCHDNDKLADAQNELLQALSRWRAVYRRDSLVQKRGPGFIEVIDRRCDHDGAEEATFVLEGVHAEILVACDSPRAQEHLIKEVRDDDRDAALAALDDLVERRLVYRSPSRQCVALPLRHEPIDPRLGSPVPPGAAALDAPRPKPRRVEVQCGQLPRNQRETTGWARHIIAAMSDARTINVELHSPPLDRDAVRTAIPVLAAELARHGAQIELRAPVAATLGREDLRALWRTGLVAGRLPPVVLGDAPTGTLLDLGAALRRFTEAGIAVEWSIAGAADQDLDQPTTAALIAALAHLPPPGLPVGAGLPGVLERWRDDWMPDALTFSRGPGFARVVDRRGGARQHAGRLMSAERILVLVDAQAEVFTALSEPVTDDGLAERMRGRIPIPKLRGFLALLAEYGLIASDERGRYLALPIHRKLVEVG